QVVEVVKQNEELQFTRKKRNQNNTTTNKTCKNTIISDQAKLGISTDLQNINWAENRNKENEDQTEQIKHYQK
ncbi:18550_t:CDS:2, partial [Gigaspora rosea]